MPLEKSNFEHKKKLFIEAYLECQDMAAAAQRAGLNMLVAFKILKMSGAMLVSDRLKYGSTGSKMGAMAKIEFSKLVPRARQMNSNSKQHPSFDFLVDGKRVDIKASSLRKSRQGHGAQWTFPLIRSYHQGYGADFYILFCALVGQKLKDGYDLYVVPVELLGADEAAVKKCITISASNKDGHWLSDFKIEPSELNSFFDDINSGDEKNTHERGFFKVELEQVKKLNAALIREGRTTCPAQP